MTVPDPVAPGADERLCGFRRCRAALPGPTGKPGNRPKYCQDGKTWGNGLSCKAAEAAYVAVDSVQPSDTRVTPPLVQDLRERLAATEGRLAETLAVVSTTRALLDEDLLAAYAAKEDALTQAAADRGAREEAEQDTARARAEAQEARAAAAEAERRRAGAERERDAAVAAASAAEHEQMRAEGQRAVLEERLLRAEQLTGESAELAGRLQVELADRAATLRAAEDTLTAERERARERDRAHRAELEDRDARLTAAGQDHERQIRELRQDHERTLADALDAERAERGRVLDQRDARHTAELAGLNRKLGAAEHERDQLRRAAAHEEQD